MRKALQPFFADAEAAQGFGIGLPAFAQRRADVPARVQRQLGMLHHQLHGVRSCFGQRLAVQQHFARLHGHVAG